MRRDRYLLISPCRNEAKFMKNTLDSVVNQSIQPSKWVIVDDGSTDETPHILSAYARKYPFIEIVTRKNRGHRSVGPGVIEAFYAGLDSVNKDNFEFLCKLDLDLKLPESYFEILMRRMDQNPRLGTCSGKPYFIDKTTGKLISENLGDENSIGASKFYRVACFKQIGGFVRQVMWDGIDGHRCRILGWIACSWDEPDLRFIHFRPMGSSQKGMISGRMRHGYGQYFMGTDLIYMTASALYRMTKPPFIAGGVAMWIGYIRSLLSKEKRLDDPSFRKFMRKYQWACMLRGKNKATERINKQGALIWNPLSRGPYQIGAETAASVD